MCILCVLQCTFAGSPEQFSYLNQGMSPVVQSIDDAEDFVSVRQALSLLGTLSTFCTHPLPPPPPLPSPPHPPPPLPPPSPPPLPPPPPPSPPPLHHHHHCDLISGLHHLRAGCTNAQLTIWLAN